MKTKTTLLFLLNSIILLAQQGAPASYYNGFNWNQSATALRNALSTKITTTHTNILTYGQAENALKIIDLNPADNTNTQVLLIYGFDNANYCNYVSEFNFGTSANWNQHRRRHKQADVSDSNQCAWNREHVYPRSLGTPNLGEVGAGADAHHLRSCDVDRNSDRGNKKFFAGAGNSYSSGNNWYPGDEWKGDIARMMMYMYLRYGNQCLPKNVANGVINASDTNMINLLLQWNAEDPVSQYEDNRNNYLGNTFNFYGQGNRNPFIDNPFLATLIWGGSIAQNRWPTVFLSTPTFDLAENLTIYPNPTSTNQVFIASEMQLDEIQLISINGHILQQLKKPAVHNTTYSIENIPQGFYILRLSANNQTVVRKLIVN